MEPESMLPFKVGDLAECRSYLKGFRSAWFKCKIKEICVKEGKLVHALEFFDFPDEKIQMTRVYQFPGRRAKGGKLQLMVRPKYPPIYHDSQIPDAHTVSEASVVINGQWDIGDLVDWWSDGCYWSGTITEIYPGDEVQITLPKPPVGEGESYKGFCKDLRPSLDWSPDIGWSVQGGESSCRFPRVIKPVNAEEPKLETNAIVQEAAVSLSYASSSQVSANSSPLVSRLTYPNEIPGSSLGNPEVGEPCPETNSHLEMGDNSVAEKTIFSDSVSTSHVGDTPAAAGEDQYECSGSSKKRTAGETALNCMMSDTLEAAVMDLEELLCKVKWMKRMVESGAPSPDSVRSQWKFVEHRAPSKPA